MAKMLTKLLEVEKQYLIEFEALKKNADANIIHSFWTFKLQLDIMIKLYTRLEKIRKGKLK